MSAGSRQGWRDVRHHIHTKILNRTYRPGDKLPRDEDFARELDCARSTVHRAMRSLAEDGVIERRRKGGTTVNPDPVTRTILDIPITRIEIEGRGCAYHHHVIATQTTPAPALIAAKLGGGLHHRVQALHLADGRPYVLEDRWVALRTVPEFRNVDLTATSANEWLVRNRPYNRCEVQIFAGEVTTQEAELMQETPGAALLMLERTTWIDAAPITHMRAIHARGYRLLTNG